MRGLHVKSWQTVIMILPVILNLFQDLSADKGQERLAVRC